MAQPPKPFARLYVLFARDAPIGVIFRRGPSKQFRLILWHTDTDIFELGQWYKGRIDTSSISLSPDGRLLAYAITDYSARAENSEVGPGWIAVSRPPYLTAVGLWSTRNPYYGGTYFLSNHELLVAGTSAIRRPPPDWLAVREIADYSDGVFRWNVRTTTSCAWEWQSRGWDLSANHEWIEKPVHDPRWGLEYHRGRYAWERVPMLREKAEGTLHALAAEQAEIDPAGRLILVRKGKLFAAAVADDMTLIERELADFNDMVFEPIPPPDWATKWPEP